MPATLALYTMKKRYAYKRQQRTIGSFVKIPIDSTYHTYARILRDASFAFYDSRTKEDISDLSKIASSPILFIVAVFNDAVTRGRWVKVGKLRLEPHLLKLPPKFIRDSIDPTQFSIYEFGKIRPATREECQGLERAAVYEPRNVEERLRDHYAGRPNRDVEEDKRDLSGQ